MQPCLSIYLMVKSHNQVVGVLLHCLVIALLKFSETSVCLRIET
jgi:hypothetical protein